MTLFVDADSCPAAARSIVERRAAREKIQLVYAANREIPFSKQYIKEKASGLFRMAVCSAKDNAADDYIVSLAAEGDIALTRDVPLAARLVENGVLTIDDRGREFTKDNIRYHISLRDLNIAFAELGGARAACYGEREKRDFANALDKLITSRRQAAAESANRFVQKPPAS